MPHGDELYLHNQSSQTWTGVIFFTNNMWSLAVASNYLQYVNLELSCKFGFIPYNLVMPSYLKWEWKPLLDKECLCRKTGEPCQAKGV